MRCSQNMNIQLQGYESYFRDVTEEQSDNTWWRPRMKVVVTGVVCANSIRFFRCREVYPYDILVF